MNPSTPTATLIAHKGAEIVTREALKNYPAPARTDTHVPVAHMDLVESLTIAIQDRGLSIRNETFALQTQGMKLFGTFVLEAAEADFAFALGFRAGNDKSMAISLVAGLQVFVCDNMAFNGSMITLRRKHTSGLNLQSEILAGVMRAISQFDGVSNDVRRMKAQAISDVEARARITEAVVAEVMPSRLVKEVAKNYFTPPHEEFQPRTAWSLHNAFTEAFKLLTPTVAMQSAIDLGTMFSMGTTVH